MALMKAADDRLSKGIASGELLCVYWPPRGQEAIAAAVGVCLRTDDQLVTTYRGLHDLIGKGVPLVEIYGEMLGRSVGAGRGKGGTMHIARPESGVAMSTGIVGAGPPVAVGLAMAAQRKGSDQVTVVCFGDGATNTGSFHEAANMAALWDLPVVLLCQNNLYGEMTPVEHTMKVKTIADRAQAYGMPGRACGRQRSTGHGGRRWRRRWTGPAAVPARPCSTASPSASRATTSGTPWPTSRPSRWRRPSWPIRSRPSVPSWPRRESAVRRSSDRSTGAR